MSTETQAQPGAAERAYDHVMQQVYNPVYFGKLAEAGVVPRTDREAQQLLHIGGRLFAGHQREQEKQAAADGTFLDLACARLDAAPAGPAALDHLAKQAAAEAMADPALAAAAVTLADALRGG